MTVPREGARVSYVGDDAGGPALGDQGRVVAHSGSASHVRWLTGQATGQITLVAHEDLVQPTAARMVDDDLSSGPLVAIAVREVYDETGEVGLLNALAEAGHLAAFSEIAEEALGFVQGKVASDPSVAEALSHLESNEQMEVLSFLTAALLRDAFGREES